VIAVVVFTLFCGLLLLSASVARLSLDIGTSFTLNIAMCFVAMSGLAFAGHCLLLLKAIPKFGSRGAKVVELMIFVVWIVSGLAVLL
jgi:hypothetical protein